MNITQQYNWFLAKNGRWPQSGDVCYFCRSLRGKCKCGISGSTLSFYTDVLFACPFCGGKKLRLCDHFDGDFDGDFVSIVCEDCIVTGPLERSVFLAAVEWNKRMKDSSDC